MTETCSVPGCAKKRGYSDRCRKHATERLNALSAALADEYARFNQALRDGANAVLDTVFGPYDVLGVRADHWYATQPSGQPFSSLAARSFCGCNDGAWADLLRQAGVARHPMFAS